MTDTTIPRVPLGASTTNRKWWLDIEDPANPGTWVGVFGVQEFKPMPGDGKAQDDGDFDGGGYTSSTTVTQSWGATGKVGRKTPNSSSTAYDPGQEIMRKLALGIGRANRAKVRFYEMEPSGPRLDATTGYATFAWSPDGGGMDALDTASFTITGQGAPTDKTHPSGATLTPLVTLAEPSGVAATGNLLIKGAGFTGLSGAASVKIDGVNMASYNVYDDNTILAVMPAGTAGAKVLTVGTSTIPYTRG